ncbi:phage head closure protein [Mesorhizobium sp. KR2-14]|uniref:phage head closure protein n=1 Tax=Mesorhizobium sp. KR2-14 TaxID=3156610 RepID=UPI0032B59B28
MRTQFIDPGRLSTELALEACTPTPDGLGGHEQVWSEVASVFAMIEPVSAQVVFGAGQMLETVTHRITIRWREGVASGMRLTKPSRSFDILTVHDPDESGRYLVCRAKEVRP